MDFSKRDPRDHHLVGRRCDHPGRALPVGDKHWIKVQADKDAALAAKAKDRAFEVAGYRYDAIFRPLEQLLVAEGIQAAGNKRQRRPTAARRRPSASPRPPRRRDQRRPAPDSVAASRRCSTTAAAARRAAHALHRRAWCSHGAARSAAQSAGAWWYVYRAGELGAGRAAITCSIGRAAARPWACAPGDLRAVSDSGRALDVARGAAAIRLRVARVGAGGARRAVAVPRPRTPGPARPAVEDPGAAPTGFVKSRPACRGRSPRSAASRPAPDSSRTAVRRSRWCA